MFYHVRVSDAKERRAKDKKNKQVMEAFGTGMSEGWMNSVPSRTFTCGSCRCGVMMVGGYLSSAKAGGV